MSAPRVTLHSIPDVGIAVAIFFDANGNQEYIGRAKSIQPSNQTISVSSVSTANPAVFSATAHGLQAGNKITISGASGDWDPMNGSWAITWIDADSFSIPVDSTLFVAPAAFDGTVVTRAPLVTKPVWSIEKFYYDLSNRQTRSAWANGSPGELHVLNSRTTYAYQ